ncbi:MAG: succinate dehydrogenase cytochrome b subunit [Verrucomicrobia bacterium]|nr:succinate dehydrogenase cytochrome b subunit [Verrucomicrobiota bacterium]
MSVASPSTAPVRVFSKNPFIAFYQSSIGKKYVVAVTALILILYVLGHLAGNLQIFIGPDRINAYAKLLHDLGPILWVVRIFLLAAFVIHIVATIQLAHENRLAKPQKYAVPGYQRSSTAARTMLVSGVIVFCFVVYHLLQFTFEVTDPRYHQLRDSLGRHDVYRMLILGFRHPLISLFYIVGLFLLTNHLSHGLASVVQTLGINNRKTANFVASGGQTLAWVVFAGYVSIPVTILLGIIK